MVLAALCELFLPSDRGLSRNHNNLAAGNDGSLWHDHHYGINDASSNPYLSELRPVIEDVGSNVGSVELVKAPGKLPSVAAATKPRRRRFMASKFLASAAADFDVVTDWAFYFHCYHANQEYFVENPGEYMIPPYLVKLVLATCVIGTSFWLILATDGKIASPLLRFFGYDRLNLGHVLLACVVVEDLSQVVLTFIIEDYYEDDNNINSYALVNVVAAFYDILIKLAEAYDQREDVVETGSWCKEIIRAHTQRVTSLVVIPEDDDEDEDLDESAISPEGPQEDVELPRRESSITVAEPSAHEDSFRMKESERRKKQREFQNKLDFSSRELKKRQTQREIMFSQTTLPPIRFLSASKDGRIMFWDTSSAKFNNKDKQKGRQPEEEFYGHSRRVSCIEFMRKWKKKGVKSSENDWEESSITTGFYFLTGSYDGTCKLWSTGKSGPRSTSESTYETKPIENETIEVTSIAYVRDQGVGTELVGSTRVVSGLTPSQPEDYNEYFVSGHKSGKARLWNIWSGVCLKIFEERPDSADTVFSLIYNRKKSNIYSMCSMKDSRHFVTGLVDGRIQLWDWSSTTDTVNSHNQDNTKSLSESTAATALAPETLVSVSPKRTFYGHKRTVLSLKRICSGSVFLSGSEDRTAMLWSVSRGTCLRRFKGHRGPIHDVAVVDQVTIMTASSDRTVRVWDTFSPKIPFRTYDHEINSPVTAVAISDQGGCFASGAEDGSIGLWIFSSVRGNQKEKADDSESDRDDDDDIIRAIEEGPSQESKITNNRFCGLDSSGIGFLDKLTATEDYEDMYAAMSGSMSSGSFVSGSFSIKGSNRSSSHK